MLIILFISVWSLNTNRLVWGLAEKEKKMYIQLDYWIVIVTARGHTENTNMSMVGIVEPLQCTDHRQWTSARLPLKVVMLSFKLHYVYFLVSRPLTIYKHLTVFTFKDCLYCNSINLCHLLLNVSVNLLCAFYACVKCLKWTEFSVHIKD